MAETVKIDIPHRLTREEARDRIAKGFDRIRSDATGGFVKFEDEWTGDRLVFHAKVMMQRVAGHLDILDDHVHVEIELPAFLAGLAEKLTGKIRKEGQVLLEKK